ncbi:MAG TPA: hypothetical protein VG733_20045 [Chthoniobacteraceae bacterium]|nr:hypothetical protein [Chthoniobacteraceae bacterium]
MNAPAAKSTTTHIAISEPDEELLHASLIGRDVSPEMRKFLQNLVRTKKWTRKITLPSAHEDVAVALVFASSLKESGLEIVTELHVFFKNRILIEEWKVVGENDKTSDIPKEAFSSMSIRKVYVNHDIVHVELTVPLPGREPRLIEKCFDFGEEGAD